MEGGINDIFSNLFLRLGSPCPENKLRPDCPYNFGKDGSPE
jgi:hypothetical protein